MQNRLMFGSLIILLVLSVGAFVFVSDRTKVEPTKYTNSSNSILNPVTAGVSLVELNKHNNSNDCWVVFQNKVYDVTSFLPMHPGGVAAIARSCGDTSFEERFTKKHGTAKIGTFMKVTQFKGDLI